MTLTTTLAQRSGTAPAQVDEVLRLLALFGLIDRRSVDRAERDTNIYELRGQMTEAAIAERFEMAPRHVRRIVRTQIAIRRIS